MKSNDVYASPPSIRMKAYHAARRKVLAKYPEAFCWKEFTVSDHEVKTAPGGKRLAYGITATEAWEAAGRNL